MNNYYKTAYEFIDKMPYKEKPYSGRNWGHPWHSLCSYHGKLKPAIAHFLISEFTNKGDVILDPLCGVGTIPFEACLQGRTGIGNDLSQLAYVITNAKLNKPNREDVDVVISQLNTYINENLFRYEDNLPYRSFGFNKTLIEYFEINTFKELLCARDYFTARMSNITPAESVTFAALLHVLHGNRPYALSRTSHPLTPYAPKGDFIYKNVVKHITAKIDLAYSKGEFTDYKKGNAILGDYSDLGSLENKVDFIICSPPFVDSIKFYMSNWMRLWLCGWEPDDFKTADDKFLDVKQKKNFDIYQSFFSMCNKVLKSDGKIILHLGKTKKLDMADELVARSNKYFKEIYRGCEKVDTLEKHGIKDKGGTIEHQFLFLSK